MDIAARDWLVQAGCHLAVAGLLLGWVRMLDRSAAAVTEAVTGSSDILGLLAAGDIPLRASDIRRDEATGRIIDSSDR